MRFKHSSFTARTKRSATAPNNLEALPFKKGHDCPTPVGIATADQQPAPRQDALGAVREVTHGLEDKGLVRMPRTADQLNPP